MEILQVFLILLSIVCWGTAVFYFIVEITPAWDWFTSKQMGKLSSRFQRLEIYPEWQLLLGLRIWTLLLLVAFVGVGFGMKMMPIAIALTFVIYASPWRFLDQQIRERELTYLTQLAEASAGLANARRSGLTLSDCLQEVCREVKEPLAKQLQRIAEDHEKGVTLGEAFSNRRNALNLNAFSLFALTIETTLQKGGDIAACLDSLSKSFQEEERLQGKIQTNTAAGRQTIFFLSIFPLGFLLMGWSMMTEGTNLLFTTFIGQCIFAVIIAIIFIGRGWALKILKLDV